MPRAADPRAIWLVRHGARIDFEDPSWPRKASRPHDPPLSRTGVREARAAAARLAAEPLQAIFSSPFLRCVQTARCIAEALALTIRIEPGFSEWLNAAWFPQPPEILSVAELARLFPRIDGSYRARGAAIPGESGTDAIRRSGDVARRIAAEFAGNLVVVGHGASLLGAGTGLLGIAPERAGEVTWLGELPYGCLVKLVCDRGAWRVALRAEAAAG